MGECVQTARTVPPTRRHQRRVPLDRTAPALVSRLPQVFARQDTIVSLMPPPRVPWIMRLEASDLKAAIALATPYPPHALLGRLGLQSVKPRISRACPVRLALTVLFPVCHRLRVCALPDMLVTLGNLTLSLVQIFAQLDRFVQMGHLFLCYAILERINQPPVVAPVCPVLHSTIAF